jgi:toxin YoeB
MEIKITAQADKDLQYWKKINDRFILKKIKHLLESIQSTPFAGIEKPEP